MASAVNTAKSGKICWNSLGQQLGRGEHSKLQWQGILFQL